MMVRILFSILLLTILLSGCSGDKKATELLETAQFEEKQNNREHAAKLYESIISKHPGSPAAKAARIRLGELKGQQP